MSKIKLKPLFEKKVDPLSYLLRDIFKDNNFAISWLGALSIGIGVTNTNNINAQDSVEEVIVTASKKEQRIQDVAMSVQAISAADLERKNVKGLEDIANLSPAVTFENVGPGKSNFYIRGVSDGSTMNSYAGTEATAALYLDEQPLTAASLTPDLHVYDVERVEVLMGPQGTLYGSSSTSGNIKIITKKPDPSSIDYGFDAEYGSITDGGNDQSLEAFVNIPLGSNFAARLSTYDLQDGGWIDNQRATYTYQNYGINYTIDNYTAPYNVAKDDYNEYDKKGSRLRLSTNFDNINLDLSFLNQDSTYSGSYEADVLTDDQSKAMPARTNTRFTPETYEDEFDQISATLSGNINDDIDFVLTSSIFERDTAYTYDYSSYVEYYYYAAYPSYVCDYYDYYYYGNISNCRDPRMSYAQTNDIQRTATEFRIQSSSDSGFSWVLGAFKESSDKVTDVDYIQPGSVNGLWWEADLDRETKTEAIFGEAYFDLSEKTSLTLGFRDYEHTTDLVSSDGYYGSYSYTSGGIDGKFSSSESGIVPKINLKHYIKDDVMVYGNYTEGFRPAGVNRVRADRRGLVPVNYDADYLESLEFGVKSTLNDGKLILNAAYYQMDWSDFQTTTYNPDLESVAFVDNVGDAEINGFELDITYLINDVTSVTAYFNSNDPTLSEDYYGDEGVLTANAGNRLSNMPKSSYYLSLDRDIVLMGLPGFLNIDYSFVGDRFSTFENVSSGSDIREVLPSYGLANMRLGVEMDNSIIEAYISNIADEDGYLSRYDDFAQAGDPATSGYPGFGIRRTGTKPRVIGIRYRYRF